MTTRDETTIHKAFVRSWQAHKAKTGATQSRTAQQLDMNQSAFSQYLKGKNNGGIGLNDDFVNKYCALVGISPSDLGWKGTPTEVTAQYLPVLYTSDGSPKSGKKIAITSVISNASNFAVEVIMSDPRLALCQGDHLICTDEPDLYENDIVFMVCIENLSRRSFIGRLQEDDESWGISAMNGVGFEKVAIPPNAKLFKIVGSHFFS